MPIPYFSDFLVVHQYNSKIGAAQTSHGNANVYNNEEYLSQKRENTINFDKQLSNLENLSNIYPTRKSNRTNNWRGSQMTNEARIGDFELNHLFILNKCKLFYSRTAKNQ